MILKTIAITKDFFDIQKVCLLANEAFPSKEHLASDTMIEIAEDDDLDFWALYDGNTFVGFMTVKTQDELSYLLFLAIDASLRSKGYGSRAIETLKAIYKNYRHIVDMEILDTAAENSEQRQKRRSFYLRNGFYPTGYGFSLHGVTYEVMCSDQSFEIEDFRELLSYIASDDGKPNYFEIREQNK